MRKRLAIGFGILALCAAIIPAALAKPAIKILSGRYSGEYTCAQGITGLTVDLRQRAARKVDAIVTFYEHPQNPGVPSGCFTASGTADAAGHVTLNPGQWIVRPGPDWEMVVIDGRINASHRSFAGDMVFAPSPSDCTTFTLTRNAKPFKAAPAACTMPDAIS
jgi:hypothetical protein